MSSAPAPIDRGLADWLPRQPSAAAAIIGTPTTTNSAPPANTWLSKGSRALTAVPKLIEPVARPTAPATAPSATAPSATASERLLRRATICPDEVPFVQVLATAIPDTRAEGPPWERMGMDQITLRLADQDAGTFSVRSVSTCTTQRKCGPGPPAYGSETFGEPCPHSRSVSYTHLRAHETDYYLVC